MASSGIWSSTANADIKKKSLLVKIKTSRKKLFVLREESSNGPARLEYYDSEKKFKAGVSPKRCIVLKNCLSINGKTDSRHRHSIFLYTKDECFGLAFDNEADQQDWLTTMLELRSQVQEENTLTKPLFEHIWVVNLKSKGRTCLPSGPYHLCLTNTDISLIRLNHDDQPIILPLDCIRRCGHSHDFFFIELGRSALTGAGELWLQVEDAIISQNMHEAILNAMRNNSPPGIEPYRARTSSNAEHVKKRPSLYGSVSSSTSGHMPKRSQSISVHKEQQSVHRTSAINSNSHPDNSYGRLDSGVMTSSIDELDAGYPSSGSTRSITPDDKIEEESDYFSMNPQQSLDIDTVRLPPDGSATDYLVFKPGDSGISDAHSDTSMPGNASASLATRSQSSVSEMDAGDRKSTIGSRTWSTSNRRLGPVSSSSSTASEYMEMNSQSQPAPTSTIKTASSSSVDMRKSTDSATTSVSRRSTMSGTRSITASSGDATIGKPASEEGYMEMKFGLHPCSTGAVLDEAAPGSSGSVSSVMSATSGTVSSVMSSRSGIAIEQEMGFHSLSRLPELYTNGYMEMSPPRAFVMPNRSTIGRRLDVVHSYLRDDDSRKMKSEDVGDTQDFPKRAYSVGSKPEPGKTFTAGSYVDMSGTCSSSAVAGLRWSIKNETERSCSAPHLSEDAGVQSTTAAAAAEVGDLFMELDFNRRGDTQVKDFRDRASSGGSKDLKKCTRTLSYSAKDALARITFFRPPTGSGGPSADSSERRPRTSTICQESLRPRTSSFGAHVDDSRPRSSSGGNARLRDVFGYETALGTHRFGLKSKAFASGAKQFSAESSVDSLNAGADYTDMFPGGMPTTNNRGIFSTRAAPNFDEYIPMNLGDASSSNVSEYVPMHPGGDVTVSTANSASAVSDYMVMDHSAALRKDTSKLPSEISAQRLADVSSVSIHSDYMSMQPGETTAASNKMAACAISSSDDYMSMLPGETATSTSKSVPDYMPMGVTGAARKEPQKPSTTDICATLTAPVGQTTVSGVARKLSGSVLPERVSSGKEDLVTTRLPFELEAGLSSLHYAAPSQGDEAATTSPVAYTSPTTTTLRNVSPYFMMGGSSVPSEISYAALDLGRHRTVNETVMASVTRTSTLGSIGRRGSDSGSRCSHVYAEIDFATDKHRPPTTSCADK